MSTGFFTCPAAPPATADVVLHRPEKGSRRRAFSLVEVTLALGIISFALVALLGTMPVGLNTMRQAALQTTESQIVREVSANALMTSYTNYSGKSFFYDDEGVLLTNSPAPPPTATRYWVTAICTSPVFPGSTNAPDTSPLTNSLSALQLQVVAGSSATAANKSTNIYTIQIPNSGE